MNKDNKAFPHTERQIRPRLIHIVQTEVINHLDMLDLHPLQQLANMFVGDKVVELAAIFAKTEGLNLTSSCHQENITEKI